MMFLATKQLLSKKTQNILIMVGIALGTILYITISATQLGMRDYISEQLLNNTAHVLISGSENSILKEKVNELIYPEKNVYWIIPPQGKRDDSRLSSYQAWARKLNNDTRVVDFVPRLSVSGMAYLGKFSAPISIVGTVPLKQINSSNIETYMSEGSFKDLAGGGNKIIIGIGIAKNLGANLRDFIDVNVQKGITRSFRIVGIIDYGNKQIDDTIAYSNLSDVQILNETPGRVTSIAVTLTHMEMAPAVADEWGLYTRDKVEDWQEAGQMFMEMIKMQDASLYFITVSILIVAAFGIYNILSIMINQKKREIAILRSIGFPPSKILTLFLYQGLILGCMGGALGQIVGFVLSKGIESIDLGFEIGKSNHLIVSYTPEIYYTSFISAIVASLIASYIPARRASRMTPMEIIRDQT